LRYQSAVHCAPGVIWSYVNTAHIYVIGFWKTSAAVKLLKSAQFKVNCGSLKIALGLGVTLLSKRTSIAGGMKGVGVIVAVSVVEGVFVIVGLSVIVGESVIVGLRVMLGVNVMVGEGGKYR